VKNSLPTFTCISDGRTDLWPDTEPMGYGAANQVGRDRAADLVEVMRRTATPALLGHVIEAIVRKGIYGGVEVGFFHALSVEVIDCHPVTEFVEIQRDFVPPRRTDRPQLSVVG
jgi:hypothetical protein